MLRNERKGFTLIELLVVIAIIGLLSTLAIVALNSARAKSRDSKRISDVKQIQTALELYFADQSGYPAAPGGALGAAGATTLCSTSGWAGACVGTSYMGQVPENPTPNGTPYTYTLAGGAYSITFTLEGPTGTLKDGADAGTTVDCTADANGVTCV